LGLKIATQRYLLRSLNPWHSRVRRYHELSGRVVFNITGNHCFHHFVFHRDTRNDKQTRREKMSVDMVTKLWMGGIILFGLVLYCAAYWVAQQNNR
jgi:hypothetical protein